MTIVCQVTRVNTYMRCIYKIQINDRYYIGSTCDLVERERLHFTKLRSAQHPNKFLQNLYNKYGEYTFKFSVVEVIDDDVDTLEVEQPYLNEHFGQENCVNLSPIAGGGKIYTPNSYTINKGLDTKRSTGNWGGNPYPSQAIAVNTGSIRSDEFCENMSNHKKEFYQNNPDKLESFKQSAAKGRKNRWNDYNKPFIIFDSNNDFEYGPFRTQKECLEIIPISNVSLSQLFSGKKQTVKGFSIKFIPMDK